MIKQLSLQASLKQIINDTEDAAREIYYAMAVIPKDSSARANLKLALQYLGVHKPSDVGLSDRIQNALEDTK